RQPRRVVVAHPSMNGERSHVPQLLVIVRLAPHASSTNAPDAAEIAGPHGKSKGTESENPTNAATSADATDQKNTPRIVRDRRSPVTAGNTRKLNTSITPANCIADAITTPSVRYSRRSHHRTL